jgi:hypothetical protein
MLGLRGPGIIDGRQGLLCLQCRYTSRELTLNCTLRETRVSIFLLKFEDIYQSTSAAKNLNLPKLAILTRRRNRSTQVKELNLAIF